jgi:general secretion pathway protein L
VRETLYIRMRATDPGAPSAYCVARADAMASFVVEEAPLEALVALAENRRLVVLVPSADVRLATVQLPARQLSKVLQAVPFALEDQLADDVDTLHFAVGGRQTDGTWPVAAVARERIDAWLGFFTARGLRPDALIPDVLALPVPDGEHLSLLVDGAEVIVRTGLSGGFVCLREDLELCLQLVDPERTRVVRAVVPRDQAFDLSRFAWRMEPLHGFGHPLEALLQGLRGNPHIDLLQGEYSPRQDWLRLWHPWRAAAGLALAALVLGATVNGVQAYRLGAELEATRARNEQRYQQVFPTETRIVDLEAQLSQQLARLSGSGSGGALLPLMNVVAAAVGEVPGLTVQAAQFRDAALYVGLSAESLQSLEQLKTWFEKAQPARLEVQSANASDEGVQIRIKLTQA